MVEGESVCCCGAGRHVSLWWWWCRAISRLLEVRMKAIRFSSWGGTKDAVGSRDGGYIPRYTQPSAADTKLDMCVCLLYHFPHPVSPARLTNITTAYSTAHRLTTAKQDKVNTCLGFPVVGCVTLALDLSIPISPSSHQARRGSSLEDSLVVASGWPEFSAGRGPGAGVGAAAGSCGNSPVVCVWGRHTHTAERSWHGKPGRPATTASSVTPGMRAKPPNPVECEGAANQIKSKEQGRLDQVNFAS